MFLCGYGSVMCATGLLQCDVLQCFGGQVLRVWCVSCGVLFTAAILVTGVCCTFSLLPWNLVVAGVCGCCECVPSWSEQQRYICCEHFPPFPAGTCLHGPSL